MTRALAIFLIAVHMMNIMGSYGILAKLEVNHLGRISNLLDEDQFSGSTAITLRIPFSLPYSTYSENYERVSGRIEYEGEVYQLVKQKFHNDTLFIVCAMDGKLGEINRAFKDLASSMCGDQDGKSTNKALNLLVKDFEACLPVEPTCQLFQLAEFGLPEYIFLAELTSQVPPDQPPCA